MFTVWHELFSLVVMLPRVRIEALSLSQYRVTVYTVFFKQRTSRFNFHSYVLTIIKINISFFSKVGSPGVNLSAFSA